MLPTGAAKRAARSWAGRWQSTRARWNAGEFDLVGFAVGVVEADKALSPDRVRDGDVLIGLHSPGLRSNGYSLARRLFFDVAKRSLNDPAWDGADVTVVEELLRPSVIYAPAVLATMAEVDVHSVAHITGGGIPGNLNRALPPHTDAEVDRSTWEPPAVFTELQRIGSVSEEEMANVFNLGIGMVLLVAPDESETALNVLAEHGHRPVVIGEITGSGTGQVLWS